LVMYPSTQKYYNEIMFLSFIFKEGNWKKDYYDELGELTKLKNKLKKGKVKTTHKNGHN